MTTTDSHYTENCVLVDFYKIGGLALLFTSAFICSIELDHVTSLEVSSLWTNYAVVGWVII
jgi:hypothetical protein